MPAEAKPVSVARAVDEERRENAEATLVRNAAQLHDTTLQIKKLGRDLKAADEQIARLQEVKSALQKKVADQKRQDQRTKLRQGNVTLQDVLDTYRPLFSGEKGRKARKSVNVCINGKWRRVTTRGGVDQKAPKLVRPPTYQPAAMQSGLMVAEVQDVLLPLGGSTFYIHLMNSSILVRGFIHTDGKFFRLSKDFVLIDDERARRYRALRKFPHAIG